MAGDWKNIKDKLQADGQGPSAADWQAMEAKIAAQPSLNAGSGRPLWFTWVLAGLVGVLIGWSTWYFLPNESQLEAQDSEQSEGLHRGEISAEPLPANLKVQEEIPNQKPQEQERIGEVKPSPAPVKSSEVNKVQMDVSAPRSDFSEDLAQKAEPNELESLQQEVPEPQASPTTVLAAEVDPRKDKEATSAIAEPNGSDLQSTSIRAEDSEESEEVSNLATTDTSDTSPLLPGAKEASEERPESAESSGLPAAAEAEDFISPQTGFSLSQANFTGSYLSDFASPMTYASGFNFDLEWQKGRQFLATGLAYHQMNLAQERVLSQQLISIDSSYREEISSRQVIEVRRNWVIDSMFHGRYVYDTIVRTVVDTTTILEVDTNQYSSNFVRHLVKRFYYAELPILYGYHWRMDKFSIALAGGLALQQAVAYQDEISGAKSRFGMSALLQPSIAWNLSERWSLLSRMQMRYPLQESVLFETKTLRYSFQLGVSYHW